MEWVIVVLYAVGILSAQSVSHVRAGLPWQIPTWSIRPKNAMFWAYFWRVLLKMTFWPIALIIWIARGKPDPVVLFGEKARAAKAAGRTIVR